MKQIIISRTTHRKHTCLHRYILHTTFYIIILSSLSTLSTAQSNVVAANSKKETGTVLVKWLTNEVISENGFYIYRRQPGETNWKKLNTKPFMMKTIFPAQTDYQADSTLRNYVELFKNLEKGEFKGIAKAMIIIKAMQSQPFARFLGIQYDDNSAVPGKSYQYKITQIAGSREKEIGISMPVAVKMFVPINPPGGIEINALDGKVTINWQPEQYRFFAVNVYRKIKGGMAFKKINKLPMMISERMGPDSSLGYPDVFFTDDSLENNTIYVYHLKAIDFFGRESAPTKEYEVHPKDQTPPPAPWKARAEVDNYTITLTWENRQSEKITGINIYRSNHSKKGYAVINKDLLPPSVESYTDVLKDPGFYYYRVAAVDSNGNEGKSNKTFANIPDIIPPAAPKSLVAASDTGNITLNWEANTEPDLMGYRIYRTVSKNNKKSFVLLNAEPVTENTFTDSLPVNAKNPFLYKVAAVDSSLNMSEYSNIAKTRMPDVVPPVMPFIRNVSGKEDYLTIEWLANPEPDLAGYSIHRITINDSVPVNKQLNANMISREMTAFTDRWAAPGITYGYYMFALDSTGNKSLASDTMQGALPEKSGDSIPITRFDVKIKNHRIILKWQAEQEDKLLGYVVYKRTEGSAAKPLTGMLKTPEFTDKDVQPGEVYYYEVRSYSVSGVKGQSGERSVTVEEAE